LRDERVTAGAGERSKGEERKGEECEGEKREGEEREGKEQGGGEEMRGAEEERRGGVLRKRGGEEHAHTLTHAHVDTRTFMNVRVLPVQERQKPESAPEGLTQSIRRVTSVRLEVYLGHAGGESGEREE
jgi:hypothetical protein